MRKKKKIVYEKICGIYKITNLINGRIYIGSSIQCNQRWENQHLKNLRRGKVTKLLINQEICEKNKENLEIKYKKRRHDNIFLQNDFNKNNEKNFEFKIIQECKEEDLDWFEQVYIDWYYDKQKMCYNINEFSKRPPSRKGKNNLKKP